MKHEWKIRREIQEHLNGQSRWERAYLLALEIARNFEIDQLQIVSLKMQNATSDLCPPLD